MNKFLCTASLAAAVLLSTPAAASAAHDGWQVGEIPSERVSFRDLNLHTAAGQRTAHRRLRLAAARVCSNASDRLFRPDQARCEQDSMERATVALNALVRVGDNGIELATRSDAAAAARN